MAINQEIFSVNAKYEPEIAAIANPKVSITINVFPILVTLRKTKVIVTAKITAKIIFELFIQTGFNPKNKFRSVPPDIDATAAIKAIPP